MTQRFTCTSAEPYERHFYRVHFFNQKSIRFDSWEEVENYWYENSDKKKHLKTITIEDKRENK